MALTACCFLLAKGYGLRLFPSAAGYSYLATSCSGGLRSGDPGLALASWGVLESSSLGSGWGSQAGMDAVDPRAPEPFPLTGKWPPAFIQGEG